MKAVNDWTPLVAALANWKEVKQEDLVKTVAVMVEDERIRLDEVDRWGRTALW